MIRPALPIVQRDLHTSSASARWLFTLFLTVSAVAIAGARLARPIPPHATALAI
jgi:hypothetical protein